MTIVEHICERKYFYWATWEGWMNLFLLSYPKYIINMTHSAIIQQQSNKSSSSCTYILGW